MERPSILGIKQGSAYRPLNVHLHVHLVGFTVACLEECGEVYRRHQLAFFLLLPFGSGRSLLRPCVAVEWHATQLKRRGRHIVEHPALHSSSGSRLLQVGTERSIARPSGGWHEKTIPRLEQCLQDRSEVRVHLERDNIVECPS